MDDNKNINAESLTKKEKADAAGRDVAEVAARGAGRYFGGALGGAAVDAALKTKAGQNIVGQASKQINKNPITRSVLANNQQNISRAKPIANSLVSNMRNGSDSKNMSNKLGSDALSNSSNDLLNNTKINEEDNEKDSLSLLGMGGLPLKGKLIIGIIAACLFLILFIVILIAPLISIGIIDIGGMGGPSRNPSYSSSSSVSNNVKYWWPIGNSETTTSGGRVYASGNPSLTTISSEFGMRIHPISGERKMHTGVDISDGTAPGTTNIIASKDGNVIYPSNSDTITCPTSNTLDSCGGGYGNYVMIQHSDGTITLYAHLHENSITVRTGDIVKQGQVIGKMGSSGNSTGTHLHFEVRTNSGAVQPLNYVSMDNPRPKTKSSSYVGGSSNKQSVCLTLKASGFSDNAVAALLTNINYESSFNPTALGDNGTSYGLCQWHNGRYDNLRTAFPDSYQTIDSQIDYLMYELENKYVSVYNSLVDGKDSSSDLTYNFCANFEVPFDTKNTCRNRANNSESYYNYVKNGCN